MESLLFYWIWIDRLGTVGRLGVYEPVGRETGVGVYRVKERVEVPGVRVRRIFSLVWM